MTQGQRLFDESQPGGDFRRLTLIQDPESGLKAILAIHRFVEGRAAGGIRRATYPTEEAGLLDAMGLAQAMSYKAVLAELPTGGAKTVMLDHAGLDPEQAYRVLGQAIDELEGSYLCGPDLGTGETEMAWVRRETEHANPAGNQPGASTARGVLAGMRGLLEVLDDDPSPDGKRIVVQGLGSVGLPVAEALLEAGATVLGTDTDEDRRSMAQAAGVELIEPNQVHDVAADLLAPCAVGGTLSAETIEALEVRGVCGSANRALASPQAGDLLHEAGILYAPDVLVNAGAVIEGVLTTVHGQGPKTREAIRHRIDGIQDRVRELLEDSLETDVPSHRLAQQIADARLEERADR